MHTSNEHPHHHLLRHQELTNQICNLYHQYLVSWDYQMVSTGSLACTLPLTYTEQIGEAKLSSQRQNHNKRQQ